MKLVQRIMKLRLKVEKLQRRLAKKINRKLRAKR